ncbi:hypothetical protein ACHAXT_000446 [Thalassiosira profunda]
MAKIVPALLLSAVASAGWAWAFAPPTSVSRRPVAKPLQLARQHPADEGNISAPIELGGAQKRRDFLLQTLGVASILSASSIASVARADDDYLYKRSDDSPPGDLTSQLFNPDGSLKDPNTVIEAQEKALNLQFAVPSSPSGISMSVATDGVLQSTSAGDAPTNLKASYKLPVKWNQDATSRLPLYYDSSEGKNGKSCNRISIYSVSSDNMDMSTLEKASKKGVASSLFMDQIQNKYFDQGVLKADLISGRTVRKPINTVEGEIDEQVYYEFDLAFAPLECPGFTEGNKENLGLGFCPYDNIFLVSATVLKNGESDKSGTLMCCVVECNKDEWKMANSDLKRVRSSFVVDRA